MVIWMMIMTHSHNNSSILAARCHNTWALYLAQLCIAGQAASLANSPLSSAFYWHHAGFQARKFSQLRMQ